MENVLQFSWFQILQLSDYCDPHTQYLINFNYKQNY